MARRETQSRTRTLVALAALVGGVAFMLVIAALPWNDEQPVDTAINREKFMETGAAPSPEAAQEAGSPDEVKVRETLDAFYAALSRGDVDGVERTWAHTAEAVCMRPQWPPVRGWSAIREGFTQLFNAKGPQPTTLTDVRIRVGTGTAEVAGVEVVELRGDGGASRVENVAVNVLKRQAEGWRIVGHRATTREVKTGSVDSKSSTTTTSVR